MNDTWSRCAACPGSQPGWCRSRIHPRDCDLAARERAEVDAGTLRAEDAYWLTFLRESRRPDPGLPAGPPAAEARRPRAGPPAAEALVTAGIGDWFVVDSHLDPADRAALRTIHYAT